MTVAKKIQKTPAELDAAEVAHACGTDPTRPHMLTPFGCKLGDHGYICATDGHRVAALRSEHWEAFKRADAPRLDAVLALNWVEIGEVGNCSEEADGFPRCWQKLVTFHPGGVGTLSAHVYKGPTQKRRKVAYLTDARVPWLEHTLRLGEETLGFELEYLADALAFIGGPVAYVRSDPTVTRGKERFNPLAPCAFTPIARHPFECKRFAVVMPLRT